MPIAANQLAVRKLRELTPVGSVLDSAEWAQVPLALSEAAFFSAEVEKLRLLQRMHDRILGAVEMLRRPGEGTDGGPGAFQTRERFVQEMQKLTRDEGLDPRNRDTTADKAGTMADITSERRLRLIYDVQTQSAAEYARWKAEQDPAVMAAFPAQEFIRVESRHVPRTDWTERWIEAGGEIYEGRKIALKSDAVWRKLSRFGRPWPPFDFGSGMGLRDVRRKEAERLGLIKPGEPVKTLGRTAEQGFTDDLKASIADLSPEYRKQLEATFEGRVRINGDTAEWIPQKVEQAQRMNRAETPAPKVEPGAGPFSEPEKATAEEAEALQLRHERVTIYDPSGNVILSRDAETGSPFMVRFDPSERAIFQDAIVSHNHVSAGGPSLSDFMMAADRQPAEMRVIATDLDNQPFLYRFRPAAGGWPPDLGDRYRAAGNSVRSEVEAQVSAGALTRERANAEFEDRIITRLLADNPGLIEYERIPL